MATCAFRLKPLLPGLKAVVAMPMVTANINATLKIWEGCQLIYGRVASSWASHDFFQESQVKSYNVERAYCSGHPTMNELNRRRGHRVRLGSVLDGKLECPIRTAAVPTRHAPRISSTSSAVVCPLGPRQYPRCPNYHLLKNRRAEALVQAATLAALTGGQNPISLPWSKMTQPVVPQSHPTKKIPFPPDRLND
eukprot:4020886-Prymnesium_polylepis.1